MFKIHLGFSRQIQLFMYFVCSIELYVLILCLTIKTTSYHWARLVAVFGTLIAISILNKHVFILVFPKKKLSFFSGNNSMAKVPKNKYNKHNSNKSTLAMYVYVLYCVVLRYGLKLCKQ